MVIGESWMARESQRSAPYPPRAGPLQRRAGKMAGPPPMADSPLETAAPPFATERHGPGHRLQPRAPHHAPKRLAGRRPRGSNQLAKARWIPCGTGSTPIAAQRVAGARGEALEEMLLLGAADLLPLRPGRSEPRVLKRRPKPYQYLTRPRHLMRVSPSRDHKGKPRQTIPTSSLN